MARIQEFLERDDATRVLYAVGIAVAFVYWIYHRYIASPNLTFLPRAGKAPGRLGLGINDVKRDFAKNGMEIINEGYRQVSRRLIYDLSDEDF
jgi:hypothetical protein